MSIVEILINILVKYLDFINVFSKELVLKLLEYLSINNYAIDMKK